MRGGPFRNVDHSLRQIPGPVLNRGSHLECFGRTGVPLLLAVCLGARIGTAPPDADSFDLILDHQRLEIEVFILGIPTNGRRAAAAHVGVEQQRWRERIDNNLEVGLDRGVEPGETLPSTVNVCTANQYSPSCDDRNVNVGRSGRVVLLGRQW